MAKYVKKKKEPVIEYVFEEGNPSEAECIEQMAKVIFQLYKMSEGGKNGK